jgi:Uma2 family endonuclease
MEKQKILEEDGIFPIIIDFTGIVKFLSDKHMDCLEKNNPHVKLETIGKTKLVIGTWKPLRLNAHSTRLNAEFSIWNRNDKLGVFCGARTQFRLPDLSLKMPNLIFIRKEIWDQLEDKDDKTVIFAPDMVLELISNRDSLQKAQEKMIQYLKNGVRLGWLLHPKKRKYYTYKQNQEMKENSFDVLLEDQEIMPNFKLDLNTIFEK